MQRLSPKVLLVLAGLCSVLTVFFAYDYLQTSTRTVAPPSRVVVVAARDIPARTVLTQDMVRVVDIPLDLAQPDGFTESGSVVGRKVNASLAAGDQITVKKLSGTKYGGGITAVIPSDKRAITIAVNEITGVAGRVRTGDTVDVFVAIDKGVSGEGMSKLLLQNVMVLTGNSSETSEENSADKKENSKKENAKSTSVTVAVTPDEAGQLVLAAESGKLYLALRPDAPSPDLVVARISTASDLTGGRMAPKENLPVLPQQPAVNAQPVQSVPPVPSGIQIIRGTKSEIAPAF